MITSVKISNFRSIGENVEIDLGRFTVLVGQNGSGKSNIVDALRFVADCLNLGLEAAINKRHGIGTVRRWSGGHPFNMSISVGFKGDDVRGNYAFTLSGTSTEEYKVKSEQAIVYSELGTFKFELKDNEWLQGPPELRPRVGPLGLALPLVSGDERFQPLTDVLRRMAVYSIFPDTLREPQKYDPVKPMNEHGANWLSILKDQPKSTWKPELLAALGKLTGDIDDIRVGSAGGYYLVEFKHVSPASKRPKWFNAAQESDGTLRVAGIVTALLQQPPLPVIGIEEPELTVHPGALPLVYEFMQQASLHSQVIVTTHSPELLDAVKVGDVRVVERRDGATMIARMSEDQRELVKNGLMTLGEVMRSGGIQPQPEQLDLPHVEEPAPARE